jgi:tetratricopeptide (TPR) repeat protein
MGRGVSELVTKGIEMYSRGDFDGSLTMYKKALVKSPREHLGTIYYNIGLSHFSKLNYSAAEKAFENSYYTHGNLSSGYELSMTKLFLGKFEDGMLLYHHRYWGERSMFPKLPLKKAKTSEDLRGKKVLVLNEQGFGDEILFSRGISLLEDLASEVTYQIYEEMEELFLENFSESKFPKIKFFKDRILTREFVGGFDVWIPSGDAFTLEVLRRSPESRIPFLSENPTRGDRLKIGLSFMSNPKAKNTKEKSIDPGVLKEILEDLDVEIISLQKDCDLEWMRKTEIRTFQDTSKAIDEVDLVVTVDTSTAHLAGIKGKKTLVIYDKFLDWRWNYPFYSDATPVQIKNLSEEIKKIQNQSVY